MKDKKEEARLERLEVKVSLADHVRGSPFAKVTLVGYTDFECPECKKAYRTVKTIQKKAGARLRYVFRSFPDKNSEKAAEAAESASSQGKFWEMHDLIFENRGKSDEAHFDRFAKQLGLDVSQFRKEMKGHLHLARIRAGRKAGVQNGVAVAPTFFINSLQHRSSFGLATLLPAVQAAAGGS